MTFNFSRRWLPGLIVSPFLAAGSPALPAQAERPSTNYVLTVQAEQSGAIYKQGEKAVFKIKLLLDRQPVPAAEVRWNISKDGVAPVQSGTLKLTNGAGSVSGQLDEPGFLLCRVSFQTPTRSTVNALGGAGFDPLQIKPSLPVPADFEAFWSAQKKALAAVPVNPRLTPVKSPQPGLDCFDVQADSVGAPVSGYFARPSDAQPKSLPIILTVHGAGVRSSSLGTAAGWAKDGFLALDLNAHGIPNGNPETFYTDLANGELRDYRFRGRESRETVYFRGMFLRLVRALDFLTAQPEWDGRTVVVHGSSQGGAQSIVAAGLDPRVTFFAAGVPAMCDHSGAVVGRVSGWPKLVPNDPEGKPDAKVLQAARYYDAMNFAARTKAAGILTVGFIDTTCPPTSVYAAYNALPGAKEIFNDPPSPHAVRPPANQAMRNAILKHVEARKVARGEAPPASDRIKLRVFYAGQPGSERQKDFVEFLKKHFTTVSEGDLTNFRDGDPTAHQVFILDYDELRVVSNRIQMPPIRLDKSFSRPTITVGATGAMVCDRLRLKTGYL
jgi:cephalosporin-C deacetylase